MFLFGMYMFATSHRGTIELRTDTNFRLGMKSQTAIDRENASIDATIKRIKNKRRKYYQMFKSMPKTPDYLPGDQGDPEGWGT